MKIRSHLGKVEKSQQRIKQERLSTLTLSGNSSLKNGFWAFNEHLSHFQLKADFLSYCSLNGSETENTNTLTTLNKTYKIARRLNNASQTCQGNPGLLKILDTENKNNEKFNSTEDLSNC